MMAPAFSRRGPGRSALKLKEPPPRAAQVIDGRWRGGPSFPQHRDKGFVAALDRLYHVPDGRPDGLRGRDPLGARCALDHERRVAVELELHHGQVLVVPQNRGRRVHDGAHVAREERLELRHPLVREAPAFPLGARRRDRLRDVVEVAAAARTAARGAPQDLS